MTDTPTTVAFALDLIDCTEPCDAPRPLCPCRRYPCADLSDTCAVCVLDEINGAHTVHTKPTVPAPRPSLIEQYLATQRVIDESVATAMIAAGRGEEVRAQMSAEERAEADRLRGEMRRGMAALRAGARG